MIKLFLFLYFFTTDEYLPTKYWDWVNSIESSHLMLLVLAFIYKERYDKILKKDKKLIIIRIFGENFGLFQKSFKNKRKKTESSWVIAQCDSELRKETEENKKQQRNFYIST